MSDIKQAKRLVLEQYEREYEELGMMIGRLRRDLGITPQEDLDFDGTALNDQGVSSANLQQMIKPGDLFGNSQVEATKKLLQLNNKQPLSLQEIASHLHRGKATDTLIQGPALRNLSSLLSRSEDFISVAKGRWGLLEWYPNRSKKVRKPKDAVGDNPKEGDAIVVWRESEGNS